MSAGEINRPFAPIDEPEVKYLLVNQDSHSFSLGDLVYYDSNTWSLAIANGIADVSDSFATNIVTKIIDNDNFEIGGVGSVVITDLGFENGAVYLSQTNGGAVTDVKPTTGFVQQVGWYADEMLHFNYFNAIQPSATPSNTQNGDDYIINVDTPLYTHKVRRDGSKLQVELLIKDAYSNFVLDNFIPSNLSDFMRFDYFSQVVTDDGGLQESIIFRISQELSKLTTNSPEKFYFQTRMGGNSNEAYVGDANLGVTKINSSRWLAYDTPGTIYPPIRDEAVSFTCNVDNYAAPETPRPIQLKILLYADLL